jgi:hypothetical protein
VRAQQSASLAPVVPGNEARKIVGAGQRDRQASKLHQFETQAIRGELRGDTEATALGVTARSHAPVLELCRLLIAAGADPTARLECYRGSTLSLVVRSLAAGAALTVENDRLGRPRFVRWRTRSDGAAPPMRQSQTGDAGARDRHIHRASAGEHQ